MPAGRVGQRNVVVKKAAVRLGDLYTSGRQDRECQATLKFVLLLDIADLTARQK